MRVRKNKRREFSRKNEALRRRLQIPTAAWHGHRESGDGHQETGTSCRDSSRDLLPPEPYGGQKIYLFASRTARASKSTIMIERPSLTQPISATPCSNRHDTGGDLRHAHGNCMSRKNSQLHRKTSRKSPAETIPSVIHHDFQPNTRLSAVRQSALHSPTRTDCHRFIHPWIHPCMRSSLSTHPVSSLIPRSVSRTRRNCIPSKQITALQTTEAGKSSGKLPAAHFSERHDQRVGGPRPSQQGR